MKRTEEPIVVEEKFHASADDVWRAITDLSEMKKWYFEMLSAFKPEVGFRTEFSLTNEGRVFTHQWEIVKVVPGRKIAYTWRFKEYPGEGLVSFEIAPEGEMTRLTLTSEVKEDFPDDIPEFKRESGQAGWKFFIQERLKDYLSGN